MFLIRCVFRICHEQRQKECEEMVFNGQPHRPMSHAVQRKDSNKAEQQGLRCGSVAEGIAQGSVKIKCIGQNANDTVFHAKK